MISIRPMPSSSTSRRSRSRICACVVTSSAVVGSSAISSFGRSAIAIAIPTRCRWPPESSCGKRAAETAPPAARPDRASRGDRRASARLARSCTRTVSATWSPIDCSGFSAVIGSWKIMPMSRPRSSHISASGRASRSLPSNAPPARDRAVRQQPHHRQAVIDLPEPLSPITPSTSPDSAAIATSRHLAAMDADRQRLDREKAHGPASRDQEQPRSIRRRDRRREAEDHDPSGLERHTRQTGRRRALQRPRADRRQVDSPVLSGLRRLEKDAARPGRPHLHRGCRDEPQQGVSALDPLEPQADPAATTAPCPTSTAPSAATMAAARAASDRSAAAGVTFRARRAALPGR